MLSTKKLTIYLGSLWFSILIALIVVVGATYYSYHQRQKMKAIQEHVSELTNPQPIKPSLAVAQSPDTEVDIFDDTSDPMDTDTKVLSDEECCSEEEVGELFDIHTTLGTFVDETLIPSATKGIENGDASSGGNWLRQHLIEKHGYSPDIDRYIHVLNRMTSDGSKSFQEVLDFARLEYRFNPSEDAKKLRDEFEELARHPELLVDFWME